MSDIIVIFFSFLRLVRFMKHKFKKLIFNIFELTLFMYNNIIFQIFESLFYMEFKSNIQIKL